MLVSSTCGVLILCILFILDKRGTNQGGLTCMSGWLLADILTSVLAAAKVAELHPSLIILGGIPECWAGDL